MDIFFNPKILIAAVYYIALGLIGFFSVFGIYILLRYGKSRTFAFVVSLCYALIFLSFLTSSQTLLSQILN